MDALITITRAPDVTDAYKTEAKQWHKWDSKNRKKFPYKYAKEERVLVLTGSATLTPDDGSPAVTIDAGDAVTFHVGFKCKWAITKRMTKYYAVFESNNEEGGDEEDETEAAAITCDVCDVDCVAESYFMAEDESDICPSCYEKDKDKKYKGATHQKNGEDWIEPTERPKKRTKKAKA